MRIDERPAFPANLAPEPHHGRSADTMPSEETPPAFHRDGSTVERVSVDAEKIAEMARVRRLAIEYRAGRDNAFFNQEQFIADLHSDSGSAINALRLQLSNAAELNGLPENVAYLEEKPVVVLERMAMIDLLGDMAEGDEDALHVLVELALTPVDPQLAEHVLRAMVGEKYDVFAMIASVNWQVAVEAFNKLSSEELKSVMRPALIRGLVSSGVSRDEAVRMAQEA